MRLVGLMQMHDEARHGNLRRCLDNLSMYCDDIAIYDDGSTDDSVSVAREYTDHVIEGGAQDFMWETRHRQQALERAITIGADYIIWIDADEVFDRRGTEGGIRDLCETGKSWEFYELNLWRSETWVRRDIWVGEHHERLWKVTPGMRIPEKRGLHNQLFPGGLDVETCHDIKVIHYGFASVESIERRWRQRSALGQPIPVRRRSVDESEMDLYRIDLGQLPPGVPAPTDEPMPTPIRYAEDIMKEAGL